MPNDNRPRTYRLVNGSPRPRNKRVNKEERHRWLTYLESDPLNTMAGVARRFGANYNTFVSQIAIAKNEREEARHDLTRGESISRLAAAAPIAPEDWSEEARKAMEDTPEGDEYFLLRYILPHVDEYDLACPNGELPAWQKELVATIWATKNAGRLRLEEPRWTNVTVHPGSGKTTILIGLIVKWIVANRNLRGFYITKSEDLGKARLELVKWHFTENPLLLADFGGFRPDKNKVWTSTKIVVAGQEVAGYATLGVYGAGQGIYGIRPDFIVGDDIIDFRDKLTDAQLDETNRWFEGQVMSRPNTRGWGVNIGSRMGPGDLHSFLMEQRTDADLPIFRVVQFLAHDDKKCPVFNKTGEEHTAYPEGCLLNPNLRPYRLLNEGNHNGPVWATAFQQQEVPTDEVLVKPVWIYGGADERGFIFEGCLDMLRDAREFPNVEGTSVVTCDPSPSQYWSVQWWFIEKGEAPTWHLIDAWRGKGTPYQLLDFDGTKPTGMLVEWESYARMSGHKISHLIVEQNAAQKWLFGSKMATEWLKQQGVKPLAHSTYENKADPRLGVWGLSKRYAAGKIRLPYAPASKAKSDPIIHEATKYPYLKTTDTVMASWFVLWNEKKLRTQTFLPDDLVMHTDGVDLSRYQTYTQVSR